MFGNKARINELEEANASLQNEVKSLKEQLAEMEK